MKRGAETRMTLKADVRCHKKTTERAFVRARRRASSSRSRSRRALDDDVDSGRLLFFRRAGSVVHEYATHPRLERFIAPKHEHAIVYIECHASVCVYLSGMGSTTTPSSGLNALVPS